MNAGPSHQFLRIPDPVIILPVIRFRRDKREKNIFADCEIRQKQVVLENKPDVPVSVVCRVFLIVGQDIPSMVENTSAVGSVEQSDYIQESGLPRS